MYLLRQLVFKCPSQTQKWRTLGVFLSPKSVVLSHYPSAPAGPFLDNRAPEQRERAEKIPLSSDRSEAASGVEPWAQSSPACHSPKRFQVGRRCEYRGRSSALLSSKE